MAKFCIALIIAALATTIVSSPIPCQGIECCFQTGCDGSLLLGSTAIGGSGSTSDDHAEAVSVVGIPGSSSPSSGSGWGSQAVAGSEAVPASANVATHGASELLNNSHNLQITYTDAEQGDALAIQVIGVVSLVQAGDFLDVIASGGEASLASYSNAAANGSGIISSLDEVILSGQS